MSLGKAFVEDVLMHYSSPYYDPQKAHDYYERTKVLSDKANASALTSKEQRDTFAVSRDSIAKAKAAEIDKAQTDQKTKVDDLHTTAQATADRISKTLQDLADKLNASLKTNVQVNAIPNDATPQQKAFLERQNAQIRANAGGNAQSQYGLAARQAARDRAKVSSDLSTALKTARDTYSTAMKALSQRYVDATATEKQNIHDQIAGAPAKPVKKTTKRK